MGHSVVTMLAVMALLAGCSDNTNSSGLTPVSENDCTVSCGFDHDKADETGRFKTVDIIRTTSVNMGNAIRKGLLESPAVPIPEGVECIVGKELPISFNNQRHGGGDA